MHIKSFRKSRLLRDIWEGSIPTIEEGLLRRMKTGTILDFGCGKGAGMKRFLRRGWNAVGLDPRLDDLKSAKVYGDVVCASGEKLPFINMTFDAVISSHVLHHIANPQKGLQEIFNCLRPGGYLLLAETVENNPLLRFIRNIHPHYETVPVRSRYTSDYIRHLIVKDHFAIIEEDSWGLLGLFLAEVAKQIGFLRKYLGSYPLGMDVLEEYLIKNIKPLRKYCAQYYVLAYGIPRISSAHDT